MVRVVSVFLLASIVALGYAENTKCSGEIETFRKCRETFGEAQKASHQQEQSERQAKVKQCFTSSGCKEPSSDGQGKGKGKGDPKKQQCHKDFSKSVHDLMKPCIQKKLDIVLQEEDHKDDHHGKGGFGGGFFDLKTACTTDDQRNKTKACLKSLHDSGKDGKDDREKKGEERFNANCGNKRQCLAAMSADCQTIFNKTKSARCDCAKSDVAPQVDSLNKKLQSCVGGTPRPDIDGKKESFADRFVHRACEDKEDKCSKPYQPHTGEHSWKGKGGHGSGKGKNHH